MSTTQNAAILTPNPETVKRPPVEGLVPITREELLQQEAAITSMAIEESIDRESEPTRLRFRGREILAYRIDTRRFIRAMAPHVSMN